MQLLKVEKFKGSATEYIDKYIFSTVVFIHKSLTNKDL